MARGRESELVKNQEKLTNIMVKAAEAGLPKRFIAAEMGIAETTLLLYLQKGLKAVNKKSRDRTESDKVYMKFLGAYEKARGRFVQEVTKDMVVKSDYRTKLSLLERLFPMQYGLKTVFDEDSLDKWLSTTFTEEGAEQIRAIMREDIRRQTGE